MDPILGRDEEVRQIVDVLMRRRQNNPILTGEAGVGKTAVVEGFAQRIAAGDVPPPLQGVTLRALDVGLMQAGRVDEGRVRAAAAQRHRRGPVLADADHPVHRRSAYADRRGRRGGHRRRGESVEAALARGTLRTIAATTWAEYRQYFEKDPALTRRFQPIQIGEPDPGDRAIMLRGLTAPMEKHHRSRIRRGHRRRCEFLAPLYPRPATARQGREPARHRLRARGDQPARQARRDRGRRGRYRIAGGEKAALARERDLGAAREDRIAEIDVQDRRPSRDARRGKGRLDRERALVEEILALRAKLSGSEAEAVAEREAAQAELRAKAGDLSASIPRGG